MDGPPQPRPNGYVPVPTVPQILYIHGSSARGKDSKMWNGLVSSFAAEMAKAEEEKQLMMKEQIARDQVRTPLPRTACHSCYTERVNAAAVIRPAVTVA
jgi:hypothetical protein